MREVALNQMLSSVKRGDEIFVYVGNTAFKGKYDKILSAAIGVKLIVNLKDEHGSGVLADVSIATDDIKAIGIPREKRANVHQAPDSEINLDSQKVSQLDG